MIDLGGLPQRGLPTRGWPDLSIPGAGAVVGIGDICATLYDAPTVTATLYDAATCTVVLAIEDCD